MQIFVMVAIFAWLIVLRRAYLFRLRGDLLIVVGGFLAIPCLVMWAFVPNGDEFTLILLFVPGIVVLVYAMIVYNTSDAKRLKALKSRVGWIGFSFGLIHKRRVTQLLNQAERDVGNYHFCWQRAKLLIALYWLPFTAVAFAITWHRSFFVIRSLFYATLLILSIYPLSLTTNSRSGDGNRG